MFDKDDVADDSLGFVDVPLVESDFASSGASHAPLVAIQLNLTVGIGRSAVAAAAAAFLCETLTAVQVPFLGRCPCTELSTAASSCR